MSKPIIPQMISAYCSFGFIKELNIRQVVDFLCGVYDNKRLVEDDGYYASYSIPVMSSLHNYTEVTILLDFTPTNFGGIRYWFVCQHCHKRVANIYSADSTMACRHCLGLTYTSKRYRKDTIHSMFWLNTKAQYTMRTRRMVYAGKPTRAGRRVMRLAGYFA